MKPGHEFYPLKSLGSNQKYGVFLKKPQNSGKLARIFIPHSNGHLSSIQEGYNAISNGYTLGETSIKGPEAVEEKLEKKRRQKQLSQMETIDGGSSAQEVQETDVPRRQTETRKVEAERKKKAVVAGPEAQAKAMKAKTRKQNDEDMRLAKARGKGSGSKAKAATPIRRTRSASPKPLAPTTPPATPRTAQATCAQGRGALRLKKSKPKPASRHSVSEDRVLSDGAVTNGCQPISGKSSSRSGSRVIVGDCLPPS